MGSSQFSMIPLLAACILGLSCVGPALASDMPPPHAPAEVSWLPHGYGGPMDVTGLLYTRGKGLYGFRNAPSHIGCWSHAIWGWDVNGFYRGPNEPQIDPVDCQLPIGLIYPENGMAPPARRPNRGGPSAH